MLLQQSFRVVVYILSTIRILQVNYHLHVAVHHGFLKGSSSMLNLSFVTIRTFSSIPKVIRKNRNNILDPVNHPSSISYSHIQSVNKFCQICLICLFISFVWNSLLPDPSIAGSFFIIQIFNQMSLVQKVIDDLATPIPAFSKSLF